MAKTFDKVWSSCLEIIKDIVEWQHFRYPVNFFMNTWKNIM
jgi:hypothetical protein